jgi:undecaprenyl-diphosphatase
MAAPTERALSPIHQLQTLELALACRLAEEVGNRFVLAVLCAASRVGDWGLSVLVGLVLYAGHGRRAMAAWTAASLTAVALQCLLKRLSARTRPCERPGGPPQRVPIPDKGSFPSGHTLHAVMAAVVIGQLVPALVLPFLCLAVLVATSRVALGVHYPSDVLAGGALGVIFGLLAGAAC